MLQEKNKLQPDKDINFVYMSYGGLTQRDIFTRKVLFPASSWNSYNNLSIFCKYPKHEFLYLNLV